MKFKMINQYIDQKELPYGWTKVKVSS